MVLSFPLVNGRGQPNGAEVTFCFKDILSIEHLVDWRRNEAAEAEAAEVRVVIDGCIKIDLRGSSTFEIQANYDDLKQLMKDHAELFE